MGEDDDGECWILFIFTFEQKWQSSEWKKPEQENEQEKTSEKMEKE